jgi:hypothetical protein
MDGGGHFVSGWSLRLRVVTSSQGGHFVSPLQRNLFNSDGKVQIKVGLGGFLKK